MGLILGKWNPVLCESNVLVYENNTFIKKHYDALKAGDIILLRTDTLLYELHTVTESASLINGILRFKTQPYNGDKEIYEKAVNII